MDNKAQKSAAKYLNNYGEKEALLIPDTLISEANTKSFDHALVIPTYNENTDFINRWLAGAHTNALLIVVINQPEHDDNAETNQHLFNFLVHSGGAVRQSGNLYTVEINNKIVVVADRFSTEALRIPSKQGVGLARKIGCDIAVNLWMNGNIQSNILHTSDADVTLPNDYFSRTNNQAIAAAYVYPFTHAKAEPSGPETVFTATQLYEQSLQHYVTGLTFAKSPCAYHTIGSCIAVSIPHYCQARGFPKKNGGEDFYLLNKLAKLAPIISLDGEPLKIAARISNRAPFGTGPSVDKILQLDNANCFSTYDPSIFVELKALLVESEKLTTIEDEQQFAKWQGSLSAANQWVVEQLDFASLWQHIRKQKLSATQALRHIHWWFDAFRTLKTVHELQRQFYPALPIHDALHKSKHLFTP